MDEPLSNLDAKLRVQMRTEVSRIQQRLGTTTRVRDARPDRGHDPRRTKRSAELVTTAVRTGGDGYGGISLLVIDKDTPGFTVAAPLKKMGWLCSDTGELTFEDVRVPAENVVGEENGGFVLVMQQFVNERLGLAAQAFATAQRALVLAAQYAQERETFGKPRRTSVIRHKLVDMHRPTAASRAYAASIRADGERVDHRPGRHRAPCWPSARPSTPASS